MRGPASLTRGPDPSRRRYADPSPGTSVGSPTHPPVSAIAPSSPRRDQGAGIELGGPGGLKARSALLSRSMARSMVSVSQEITPRLVAHRTGAEHGQFSPCEKPIDLLIRGA